MAFIMLGTFARAVLITLLCVIVLLIPAIGTAQQPPILKVLRRIRDHRDTGGPVGGRDVAGVMLGEPSQQINFDRLTLILPSHSQPRLCVTMTARNDTYKGLFEYDVASAGQGLRRLEITSDHLSYLRTFVASDLGVSTWLAADCGKDPDNEVRIPVSWGTETSQRLHVFVNSRTYSASLALGDEPGAPSIRCEELKPSQPSFNRDCALALDSTRHGTVTVKLKMFRFNTLIDESTLRVSVP